MSNFLQDLRYALRQVRKSPGFAAVAILTLALGIGANTTMFSVINGVLLQPLPYKDPSRLVLISERTARFPRLSASYQNFADWRSQSKSFEAVGAVRNFQMTLTGAGDPERMPAQMATANLFDMLGVKPSLGRAIVANDDRAGAAGVAVISDALWQRRFSSSSQVLGQAVTLDNKPYVIVGVLPPGFQVLQQKPDIMVAMEPWAATLPDDRSWHPGILTVARLKPGVSLEQARAEMSTIAKRLYVQYPQSNIATDAVVNRMQEQMVQNVRPALLTLLGAVGFVLLIACANVANLLLARATARQREMAVRSAMGASRWRIIRQLLTESIIISFIGAALGLFLAAISIRPLLGLGGANIPNADRVHVDLWVLLFTTVMALFAGIVFGIAPALHMGRADLRSSLNETDRGGVSRGARRLRGALVISEVAVTVLLLVGAGLLIRSFNRLSTVSPGFTTDHILIADIPVAASAYPPAQRMAFFDSVIERAAALPGVRSAGAASELPVSVAGSIIHFNIQGRPPKSSEEWIMANYRNVSPGYFNTLGMRLIQGRLFTDADRESAPAVVVINETMARTFFPGESPLGKHMQIGSDPDPNIPWMEVVGIVADVKQSLATDAPTEMYVPFRQGNQVLPVLGLSVVLRTEGDPLALSNALRNAVHEINPNQPLVKVRSMEQNISATIAEPRFRTFLLTVFAAIALIIASVGIYGVMAYSVTQRTREIGVRMALGSTPARIFRLVVGDGMRMALLGVVAGVVASVILNRYLASLLFQIGANDPATLAGVSALLVAVALFACYIPARRATRVQVAEVLRQD